MSAARRDTTVTLLGREYVVGGALDPAYIERLATRLEEMLRALKEAAPGQDNEQLAVLTALNLADQLEELTQGAAAPPATEPQKPALEAREVLPRLAGCVERLEKILQEKDGPAR